VRERDGIAILFAFEEENMTPSRPYFVRAVYEWLNDNNMTPYVLVDAAKPEVMVPEAFVKDARIVLNIAPGAVKDFFIRNEALSFSARFGGVSRQIFVPMAAVLAIYARENGQGMFFNEDEDFVGGGGAETSEEPTAPEPPKPSSGGGRPSLRVVK
jgi:stringent starvation protein B